MSNRINVDWIIYEDLIRERQLEEERSRQIQLEVPEYEPRLEDKVKKETSEPKRVIIIDL